MDRITAKSTSIQVQQAAGHDRTHWRRFLNITMQEGAALLASDPTITSWRNVSNPAQQALRRAVDVRLAQEEIPAVNVRVIDWRMAQVIKDTLKKASKASMQIEYAVAMPEDEPGYMNAEPSSTNQMAGPSTSAEPEPTLRITYYDPVRESMAENSET